MVIMALDHTRDFFSHASNVFDPTDLSQTTPLLFFTRWITHFCAPVFVFLAGAGAYLSVAKGSKDAGALSKFLISRGLWLVFLEIFVISPFGVTFSFNFGLIFLQVIWVIGLSMMMLGGLVLIWPSRLIGGVGVVMIFTHNIFDGAHMSWLGQTASAWRMLHQISMFHPWPGTTVALIYPIIPWVGVMMAGYGAGELLTFEATRRRRALLVVGGLLTILFVVLRALNIYGDPAPWSVQATPIYTVMSFVRCTKYAPSLLYLLMTLGPALVVLGLLDGTRVRGWQSFLDFGRVPLFYYLLHFPLLHTMAVIFALSAYGNAGWLFGDPLGVTGHNHLTLTDHGFSLGVVYAVWFGTVLALYPACHWYARFKRGRREAIFSYL